IKEVNHDSQKTGIPSATRSAPVTDQSSTRSAMEESRCLAVDAKRFLTIRQGDSARAGNRR
ncbi:hypothetical protein, partial [Rhizobium hidalgonense]|uniref:hypothetical protein n=1 Tax=Rhizobium hidalgonense TaxID=1538159 RepID=UPI001A9EB793